MKHHEDGCLFTDCSGCSMDYLRERTAALHLIAALKTRQELTAVIELCQDRIFKLLSPRETVKQIVDRVVPKEENAVADL
jgi:hypothetical protein